jgi:hypothetical protein
MRFIRWCVFTPLSTSPLCVHSQSTLPMTFGSRIPTRLSRSVLVVSHHLNGFLRTAAPDVLQPEPNEVRCVSVTCIPMANHLDASTPLEAGPFPATRSHPPKNTPHQQPYCITAAVALLSFHHSPHRLRVWFRVCDSPGRSRMMCPARGHRTGTGSCAETPDPAPSRSAGSASPTKVHHLRVPTGAETRWADHIPKHALCPTPSPW